MSEARDAIVRHLFSNRAFRAQREPSGVVAFRCPRPGHNDSKPSAWIGDGAWGCHGCGAEGSLYDLASLLGITVRSRNGFPLEAYADLKSFPISTLRSWGLETRESNGQALTYIPYLDSEGKLLRGRFRTREKHWWDPNGTGVYLYGLQGSKHLSDGDVLLVEGESDCHASWLMGIPALGVPGAKSWKPEWVEFLGNAQAIAWQEPDEGGETFVRALADSIPNLKVIEAPEGVKDPAQLYGQHGPEEGAAELRRLMLEARQPGEDPPPPYSALSMTWVRDAAFRMQQPVDATPTPWPRLNRMCGGKGGREGIGRGWFVLLGAKLKTGKSILAANLMAAAVRQGETASYISAEMHQEDTFRRFMAIFSGEDIRELEYGKYFSQDAWVRAGEKVAAEQERSGGKVITNDRQLWRLEDLEASIRGQHERDGATFFVVDYLQLFKAAGMGFDQIYGHTLATAHAMIQLGRSLNVTIVGVAQIKTSVPWGQSPTPHDIQNGGAWSNDADMILLLDHSKSEKEMASGNYKHWLKIWQRHGESDVAIPLMLDTRTLRVYEISV